MTPKLAAWFEKMMADPAVNKVTEMAPLLPDSMI